MLGTGAVGRALAGRTAGLGHEVSLGTRDPVASGERDELRDWLAANAGVTLTTFRDAAAGADLLVNAAGGDVSLEVLHSAGAADLDGTVLLDVANPLDHGPGFPPGLFVQGDDSLAESIQRTFPGVRVVKALNTMNNALMVDPRRLGASSTVFVSGDDGPAKAVVTELLTSFGHDDVLDLGGLETARGAEMWLPLWLRVAMRLGTSDFGLKIVRPPTG